AARDERDALLLPRAAGSTTGLVELRARTGRVRDPAVDERAAPGPGARGLRDQTGAGTGREGSSHAAHASRPTEPREGDSGSPVGRGQNAGRDDRGRAVRRVPDPQEDDPFPARW